MQVLVIGACVVGLAIARQAALAGHDVIVAVDEKQTAKIEGIAKQGEINGVEGLEFLGGNAARAMEPALNCTAALLSSETGIIDSHAFMLALQGDLEDRGGMIAFNTPVECLRQTADGWEVRFGGAEPGTMTVDAVINSAGLGAQAKQKPDLMEWHYGEHEKLLIKKIRARHPG